MRNRRFPLVFISGSDREDFVTGIDVAPLPFAAEYDCSNALLYTAEQDSMRNRMILD